ncbi:uncharacterized protein LOC122503055 [Leptopilina heterotoma]|uniref:uncharacterized protein LOC122503055 n=1 Tax=Leptopilina heterotoma TaxID=63436 RepID=UPI001CA961D3|nr:uncharacterized protein LOC122503055 [Leptopilina heterotoma]
MLKVSSDVQYASVFIYDGSRYMTLPLSCIPSFKVNNFIPAEKKYKILLKDRFFEGIVLSVGATVQELKSKEESENKKRKTIPTLKTLLSATDSSTEEERQVKKRKKTQLKTKKGPYSTSNVKKCLEEQLQNVRLQNSLTAAASKQLLSANRQPTTSNTLSSTKKPQLPQKNTPSTAAKTPPTTYNDRSSNVLPAGRKRLR